MSRCFGFIDPQGRLYVESTVLMVGARGFMDGNSSVVPVCWLESPCTLNVILLVTVQII